MAIQSSLESGPWLSLEQNSSLIQPGRMSCSPGGCHCYLQSTMAFWNQNGLPALLSLQSIIQAACNHQCHHSRHHPDAPHLHASQVHPRSESQYPGQRSRTHLDPHQQPGEGSGSQFCPRVCHFEFKTHDTTRRHKVTGSIPEMTRTFRSDESDREVLVQCR